VKHRLTWAGFEFRTGQYVYWSSGTCPYTLITVPFWFLATLTLAMLAIRAIVLHRRASRQSAGHCANCGYDIRATPNRCPECGTVQPSAA
jgi:hypothetical protein